MKDSEIPGFQMLHLLSCLPILCQTSLKMSLSLIKTLDLGNLIYVKSSKRFCSSFPLYLLFIFWGLFHNTWACVQLPSRESDPWTIRVSLIGSDWWWLSRESQVQTLPVVSSFNWRRQGWNMEFLAKQVFCHWDSLSLAVYLCIYLILACPPCKDWGQNI